jgi:hypothetical protein
VTDIRPRAAVLATIGALAVAASAYFDWLDSRSPDQIPVEQLLLQPGPAETAASYYQSMAAPLVVIGAIGVLATLFLSRALLWVTFLLALATLGLWVTTVVLEVSPGDLAISDVQPGAWINLGAVVLLLIGAAALRGRGDEDMDEDDEFDTPPLTRQLSVDDGP